MPSPHIVWTLTPAALLHVCVMCAQVRSDVAALALEEVAPLAVSTAALAAPSEVFKADAPGGEAKAEQELSR